MWVVCDPKLHFFQISFYLLFYVYVLCETWFHSGILNSEYFTSEFVVHRCDQSHLNSVKSDGGGIIVAVHNTIKFTEVTCININIEIVSTKLVWSTKALYLYAAYIPPKSLADVYSLYCENLNHLVSSSNINDIIFVLADFNLPNLHWYFDSDD